MQSNKDNIAILNKQNAKQYMGGDSEYRLTSGYYNSNHSIVARWDRGATLIHEIGHYLRNQIYQNNSEPFYYRDTKAINDYNKAIDQTIKNINEELGLDTEGKSSRELKASFKHLKSEDLVIEKILDSFIPMYDGSYGPEEEHAEFIVRYHQFIAEFQQNPEQLEQVKRILAPLGEYIEKHEKKVFIAAIIKAGKATEEYLRYAIENNIIIDGKFAIQFAIDSNFVIDGKSAIQFAIDNDLKIGDKPALQYAIDSQPQNAGDWMQYVIGHQLMVNSKPALVYIIETDTSNGKEFARSWLRWAEESRYIAPEAAENLKRDIHVNELKVITQKYFSPTTAQDKKEELNNRYIEICKELGKENLLGVRSELGQFLDDPKNIEALNLISSQKQRGGALHSHPFQDLTPEALYVNCDLKLLEKISNVNKDLSDNQGRDYSKMSTGQIILISIATIIPLIGNLIAYGAIKSYNAEKEKEPFEKLQKNDDLVREVNETLSKNKPFNNKQQHGELYHRKWADRIRPEALDVKTFTERLSNPAMQSQGKAERGI